MQVFVGGELFDLDGWSRVEPLVDGELVSLFFCSFSAHPFLVLSVLRSEHAFFSLTSAFRCSQHARHVQACSLLLKGEKREPHGEKYFSEAIERQREVDTSTAGARIFLSSRSSICCISPAVVSSYLSSPVSRGSTSQRPGRPNSHRDSPLDQQAHPAGQAWHHGP